MTITINFDKTRYIELLRKEETLKNQRRFLFDENTKEHDELLSYEIILENQIYYNRKAEYIFLVEEYLRKNASEDGAQLFVWEFYNIFKENNEALEVLVKEIIEQGIKRLATFCIEPKSTEFSTFINDTVNLCKFLTSDRITFDQFRDSIEEDFIKMRKYLDEEG